MATIDFRAGRKAKASTAYAPACVYFTTAMGLLDERDWDSQYALMFRLWLERAECEFLSGNVDKAEQLIMELLRRGTSKVDKAAVYHLKVHLQIVKGEYPQAVDSALACLRLFGIDIPAQPTWEQAEAEYETLWRNLNGRSIENLIDLLLMTGPELQATMQALDVERAAVRERHRVEINDVGATRLANRAPVLSTMHEPENTREGRSDSLSFA